jgi:hypothetical protein
MTDTSSAVSRRTSCGTGGGPDCGRGPVAAQTPEVVERDCGKHWLKEMRRCESWRRRRAGSIGQRLKRTESLGNPTRRF